MANRLDFITIEIGVFTSLFFEEFALKIVFTTVSMLVGTYFSYLFQRYLKSKEKNKDHETK